MDVKTLRKMIENFPDDAQLLVPASDHTYRFAEVWPTTALFDVKSRILTEDRGEESTPEAEYGKRINVLVFTAT